MGMNIGNSNIILKIVIFNFFPFSLHTTKTHKKKVNKNYTTFNT